LKKLAKKLSKQSQIKQEIKQEKARRNLINFTRYTFPDYEDNWHHRLLAKKLDKVVSGDIRRLMVFMPPRYGKTELASRRLPAYMLGKNPDAQIIACSYAATLAQDINRDVQKVIDNDKYRELFSNTQLYGKNIRTVAKGTYLRNSEIFEIVNHTGFYKSAGVGGGITGKGFDLGIIDDPVKNAEEAMSPTYRQKVWDWYTTTFYTRAEDNARIILIMTRWHEDDLAGRLLSQDKKSKFAEKWDVLSLPVIAEKQEKYREPGELLWPDKYNEDDINITKSTLGRRKWQSLYMQKPQTRSDAALWNYNIIKLANDYPALKRIIVAIDPAASKKATSDETGIVVAGVGPNGYGYVLEDASGKYSPAGWAKKAIGLYRKYEADAIVAETNQGGDMVESNIRTYDRNISYKEVKATRGKQIRAEPIASLYEQGKVYHVGDLVELENQLTSWQPGDDSPDRLDALVWALTDLMLKGKDGITFLK